MLDGEGRKIGFTAPLRTRASQRIRIRMGETRD
jgi:hypothetical protein